MRIIAGKYKGRRLQTPDNYDIRPTTDKVKEAMFSILAPDITESICADVFAGTGNLGLEALSRGAAKCYFFDNSRTSIGIIKTNIDHCKAEGAVVYAGDSIKNLEKIREKVDIFILDPPYEAELYEKSFRKIRQLELLSENGIIVAEHEKRRDFPDEMEGFHKIKDRKYGHIILSLYGHPDKG